MEFGVLGPLLVRDDTGAPARVRAAKQRTLMATLLLRAGHVVPVDQLVETVWDGKPPATAVPSLRNYVLRLRTCLGEAGRRIGFRDRGYVIELAEDEIDLLRFTRLKNDGAAAFDSGKFALAAQLLGRALQEWRGPALVDVESDALHREECPHLAESRLDAVELRLEAESRTGGRIPWTAELRDLARAHPERERLWGHLISTLHADGRSTEALAEYRRMERLLDQDYGVRPGERLRALRDEIESGGNVVVQTSPSPPPLQIPAAPADFTARECETASLISHLTSERRDAIGHITVISGQPGIGKTALALHVAHAVRGTFPDGILYANLHTARKPARPLDILGTFLRALGQPTRALPSALDDRAAMLRTLLTDRKALLVLDDAESAAQIIPLLPGPSPSSVLVTSRNRLDDLPAATHVEPTPLSPEASAKLIATIAGRARTAAEPNPVSDLVRVCEGLPLALRIAGTRLAARPTRSVRWLADRLRTGDLNELAIGTLNVRNALAEIYDALSPDEAQAFLRLATAPSHPRTISPREAAHALAVPTHEAERLLERLVDRYLLTCVATGYQFSPLTKTFAGNLQRERLVDQIEAHPA